MSEQLSRAMASADAARIVGEKYREGHEHDIIALADEVVKLRAAISEHRSQKADDRCIEDDDKLYEALSDGIKCDRRVGDKYEMLGNCARFIDRRCEGGGWPSYIEIEKELQDGHNLLTALGAPPQHYTEQSRPCGIFIPAHRTLAERIRSITEVDMTGTGVQSVGEAFARAVEFAKTEGYKVETAVAGSYLEWRFTDRDRALLTLLGRELTNHRGIRIPIPNRIT